MKEQQKQINKKDALKSAGWIISVIVFFVLIGASVAENKIQECKYVSIKIDHSTGLFFLHEDDALKIIETGFPGGIMGKRLTSVDFSDMEKKIEVNPYVAN